MRRLPSRRSWDFPADQRVSRPSSSESKRAKICARFSANISPSPDKIEWILQRVADGVALHFSELFATMASRVEIVVTFLALLELIRLKQVRATQTNPFDEIEIASAMVAEGSSRNAACSDCRVRLRRRSHRGAVSDGRVGS